ncbi:MAG: preprotein translocase subunit SecA [Gemmatimonadetes bacterium]|nr:preprotein translocase subunit SecA [Gemmatimonadota bacterium]
MLKKLVTSVIGTRFERDLKRIQPVIDQIHDCEKKLSSSSEAELKAQTERFRGVVKDRVGTIQQQLEMRRAEKHACADPERRDELDDEVHELEEKYKGELGKVLDDILPEAFATVREACRRLLGTKVLVTGLELEWEMVPYDVQLIGGIILHEGNIAEMATGEGKTLVATLPIYLNALAKRGVHVVTVNNYLARRDSQWMGHLLKYLGLTVGCLDDTQPSSAERRAAYECDVTYGTNNEFGFDYLRDNMVFQLEQRVQREHAYAIIDEVDSILVDEARTPLIISGPVGNEGDEKYQEFNPRIQRLIRKQTGVANELIASAERLLEDEEQRYEGGVKLFQVQKGMPKNKRFMKLIQEPETKQLLQRVELDWLADRKLPAKDQRFKDFEDQLCFIMDERGRSVHLTDLGVEEMSPDDPNLFIVPDISEAVGVLERDESLSPQERLEQRRDLDAEYAAKSEKLHIIHKLLQAHSLYEKDVEYVVQDGQVFIVDEFTGRIMAGRRWSDGLHQAIEAKEGVKIRGETQTLATITIQNFFRMYDKLSGMTGTAETEETEFFQIYGLEVMVIPTNRPVRRVDHHDLLYQSRREKYNAVIEEIERHHERGLPILVGTVSVEVSETLARMLKRRGLKFEVLNAKQHQREAEIVTQAGRPGAITIATNMAGRGTDIKLGAGVKQCDICGIKSKVAPFGQNIATPDLSVDEIRKRGCNDEPPCGLTVIGTERHESRRIDRQLRGRSGRQGDPGQSVFFLSLEDDLMRLFVSDRVAKFMEKTGVEEGEVLTHPWFTKAIENAQKRVELQNFQARKKLLEYDDVMNQQREVIYSQRLFALEGGEELKAEALKMIGSALSKFAEEAGAEEPENWDRSLMRTDLMMRYLVPAPAIEDEERVSDLSALESAVQEAGKAAFDARLASWDELSSRYNVPDLSEKLLAQVSLQVLDEKWKDHLYDLDQLRNAIHYRAWGQKDPLIEYKKEAFDLFVGLMADIRSTFAERFFKFQVQVNAPPPRQAVPQRVQMRHDTATDADLMVGAGGGYLPPGPMSTSGPGDSGSTVVAPQKAEAKVGRNDPCPCGSGKKYKKCHGRA